MQIKAYQESNRSNVAKTYYSDIQDRYYTIRELSNITGEKFTTIKGRITKLKWTVDEVLGLTDHSDPRIKLFYHSEIQNKDYSLKELENITGKERRTLLSALNRDWTVDQLLGLEKHYNSRTKWYHSDYQNKDYTIRELSEITGESIKCIRERINKWEWTVDEVLGITNRKERWKVNQYHHSNIRDKDYTVHELATMTRKCTQAIISALNRDWTVDQLLGLEKHYSSRTKLHHSEFNNKDYSSHDISTITGMKTATVRHKLRENWTVDELLGIIPPLSRYELKGPRRHRVYVDNVAVIELAYINGNDKYYECIDTVTNQPYIKSKDELIELWKEKSGIYK